MDSVLSLCATCLTEHSDDTDSSVLCDFFAPTSLSVFHASRLTRPERRKLHLDWRHTQKLFRDTERFYLEQLRLLWWPLFYRPLGLRDVLRMTVS